MSITITVDPDEKEHESSEPMELPDDIASMRMQLLMAIKNLMECLSAMETKFGDIENYGRRADNMAMHMQSDQGQYGVTEG